MLGPKQTCHAKNACRSELGSVCVCADFSPPLPARRDIPKELGINVHDAMVKYMDRCYKYGLH